jgi:hypothetical protein
MVIPVALAFALFATQPAAEAVRAADAERIRALVSADYAALDRILADELTYTHSTARMDTKAAYLEPLVAGRTRYQRLDPSDITVRVYGETAVLTGRMSSLALVTGKESRTDLRFTSVWILRDARWQMTAWQSTRIP